MTGDLLNLAERDTGIMHSCDGRKTNLLAGKVNNIDVFTDPLQPSVEPGGIRCMSVFHEHILAEWTSSPHPKSFGKIGTGIILNPITLVAV